LKTKREGATEVAHEGVFPGRSPEIGVLPCSCSVAEGLDDSVLVDDETFAQSLGDLVALQPRPFEHGDDLRQSGKVGLRDLPANDLDVGVAGFVKVMDNVLFLVSQSLYSTCRGLSRVI